ncbi:MAG TPA: hypothetical protein VF601_10680 [Beijerinckiaceae bacterium]|jgi:hypothetical protein
MIWNAAKQKGRMGFDEYVICAPSRPRLARWLRPLFWLLTVALLFAGIVLALPIASALFLKWEGYSGAFLLSEFSHELTDKSPPALHAWAMVYHAWAVPIGLLTLAALVGSAILISRQIEQEHLSSDLAQMPAVYVRPRLTWVLRGVNNSSLDTHPPRLSIDLFNVGETPAVRVELKIVSLYVQDKDGESFTTLSIDEYDTVVYYDRLVPADREFYGAGSITENLVETHAICLPAMFAGMLSPGALLQSILSSDDDFPALVLKLNVRFETVRNVKFNETIAIRWSARRCRAVASTGQLAEITELRDVLAQTGKAAWMARESPRRRPDGRPNDLSFWTRMTLSPEVSSSRSRVGRRLLKGARNRLKCHQESNDELFQSRAGGLANAGPSRSAPAA